MGRPSKYKSEYCEALVEHMKRGDCFDTFAATVNVSTDSLYRWVKAHKAFRDAKKEGEVHSKRWWTQLGKGLASGKIQGGNAAVYIFTMKNRFGWRDRVETMESDSFDDIDFVDD